MHLTWGEVQNNDKLLDKTNIQVRPVNKYEVVQPLPSLPRLAALRVVIEVDDKVEEAVLSLRCSHAVALNNSG